MKLINEFIINQGSLPAAASSRSFTVVGDINAVVSIQVRNSAGQYYDFNNRGFSATITSAMRLVNVRLVGGSFNSNISFPTVTSADNYTIYVFAEPHFDTEISDSLSDNPVLYTTIINQVVDTRITFTPITTTTDKFATMPSVISIAGSPSQETSELTDTVDIDWDFATSGETGGTFGLIEADQPEDEDWYVTTTDTVDGAISSSTSVRIDDISNIKQGMLITGVSGGSLSGTPIITNVNKITKTLTLSAAQTFADGITLTFQARGKDSIMDSSSSEMNFVDMVASVTQVTTTVRGDISATTVNVNGNYGIAKGATITGVNWNNSSSNPIVTVNASEAAGSLVMTVSQTIQDGTKLYVHGSSKNTNIKGKIVVNKYPSSNQTVYLNIDNIFTPGDGAA